MDEPHIHTTCSKCNSVIIDAEAEKARNVLLDAFNKESAKAFKDFKKIDGLYNKFKHMKDYKQMLVLHDNIEDVKIPSDLFYGMRDHKVAALTMLKALDQVRDLESTRTDLSKKIWDYWLEGICNEP